MWVQDRDDDACLFEKLLEIHRVTSRFFFTPHQDSISQIPNLRRKTHYKMAENFDLESLVDLEQTSA